MSSANAYRKFKAILFDLDGTLIEFKFKVKESRLELIEWLKVNGYDTSGMSSETKTQFILNQVKGQCEEKHVNYATVRRILSELLEKFEFEAFTEAKPHPGSLGLLKRLQSEAFSTALVTNSGRRPVDSILGVFGFLPYLTVIITRDEVDMMKPEPDGILKAISQLGVEKSESVYVGDSVIDVIAARKAGVSCIALSQGMYNLQALAKEEPDYLISRIDEVENIVF